MYNVLIVVSNTYVMKRKADHPSRKEFINYVYREFYP